MCLTIPRTPSRTAAARTRGTRPTRPLGGRPHSRTLGGASPWLFAAGIHIHPKGVGSPSVYKCIWIWICAECDCLEYPSTRGGIVPPIRMRVGLQRAQHETDKRQEEDHQEGSRRVDEGWYLLSEVSFVTNCSMNEVHGRIKLNFLQSRTNK